MLDGDLWQQEATLRVKRDQEPVTTDFDGLGGDRGGRREQRNLDAERIELFGTHGRKPWIFQRGAGRAANDGFPQRLVWVDDTDATLQPAGDMQRHENAAALRENTLLGDVVREISAGDCLHNGSTRQL